MLYWILVSGNIFLGAYTSHTDCQNAAKVAAIQFYPVQMQMRCERQQDV